MSIDRTRDFLALADAAAGGKGGAASRQAHPSLRPLAPLSASHQQQHNQQPQQQAPTYESRSAFMAAIREVSSDLNRTSLKLSALTKRECLYLRGFNHACGQER